MHMAPLRPHVPVPLEVVTTTCAAFSVDVACIHTFIRRHRHTDTQTHRHTDTKTQRHARARACARRHAHVYISYAKEDSGSLGRHKDGLPFRARRPKALDIR